MIALLGRQAAARLGAQVEYMSALEQDLRRATATGADSRLLGASTSELNGTLAALDSLVFSSAELGSVLGELSSAAASARVTVVSLRPEEPEFVEGFGEMRVDVSLSGDFHGLMQFTSAVERSPRRIRFSELSIESKGKSVLTARASLVASLRLGGAEDTL